MIQKEKLLNEKWETKTFSSQAKFFLFHDTFCTWIYDKALSVNATMNFDNRNETNDAADEWKIFLCFW